MGELPQLHLHPRGFLTDPSLPTKLGPGVPACYPNFIPVKTKGDEFVEQYYRLYIDRTVNYESWNFRKRVIATASRLFNDFNIWLRLQTTNNDYLYGLNYDFLVDTMRFIYLGHREMSPLTWHAILLEDHESKLGVANYMRHQNLLLEFPEHKATDSVISKWCSNKEGFDDMLCTLHVMFGTPRTVVPNVAK